MNFFYIILILILMSCNSNKDLNSKWNEAINFRKESRLMESITLFKELVNSKNDSMTVKAQYQIADIYLNDINNYIFAVEEFKKVIDANPDSDYAKKAIFMIGYIYSNYIESYSDGIDYYNIFLEKYPNDDLSNSVNYELLFLDSIGVVNKINELKQ